MGSPPRLAIADTILHVHLRNEAVKQKFPRESAMNFFEIKWVRVIATFSPSFLAFLRSFHSRELARFRRWTSSEPLFFFAEQLIEGIPLARLLFSMVTAEFSFESVSPKCMPQHWRRFSSSSLRQRCRRVISRKHGRPGIAKLDGFVAISASLLSVPGTSRAIRRAHCRAETQSECAQPDWIPALGFVSDSY